jgi:hypothetical protein
VGAETKNYFQKGNKLALLEQIFDSVNNQSFPTFITQLIENIFHY